MRYSQYFYEDILRCHITPQTRWLDLGCGRSVLPPWRAQEERELTQIPMSAIGIDYDFASLRGNESLRGKLRGDIERLPFPDSTFDLITANMVLEHVRDPQILFAEVFRVLTPSGLFIFHTPNVFGYTTLFSMLIPDCVKARLIYLLQGRREEDVFKTIYRANSRKKVCLLAAATGFHVEGIKDLVSSAQTALVPPLVAFELLWIRLLMTKHFKLLRTNIIAVLRK